MPGATLTINPAQPALTVVRKTTVAENELKGSLKEMQAAEERRAYGEAKMAIDQKYMEIGGETGLPTDMTQRATGEGWLRHYKNGVIYFRPGHAAYWVHGAILGKYLALGETASFLGYPTTDELGAPDGVGRYNHFQHGSIYWSPATGAAAVSGPIRDHWAELGWETSWLGYPLSDEGVYPEGGRVSAFQKGAIYWWPDTGPRALNDIVVQYTGLWCEEETNFDGGVLFMFNYDDERYTTLGIKGPDLQQTFDARFYQDVDSGDTRFDVLDLYRGKPRELMVTAVLNEHSGGNPQGVRQLIEDAYDKGTPYVADAITQIPYVGPVLGPAARVGFIAAKGDVLDAVNSFIDVTLGGGDRPLGSDVIALTTKDLILIATRPEGNAYKYEIPWRFSTQPLERQGAKYWLYFNVFPA